jgi:4-carboxymuconolactone decarboxylase
VARFNDVTRESLDADGQAAYDMIVGSRGAVIGPYRPLLNVPPLAKGVADLGSQIRFAGLLPGADRELAICAAGREMESRFEWTAHEPIALREGTRPEALEIIRTRGSLDGLTPRERTIVDVVLALFRQHALTDALFERARVELGEKELMELVVLAGYYGMISFVLSAYAVPLPEGRKPPF